MALSRFTDLILRRETFWVAVALFIIGSVVPGFFLIRITEIGLGINLGVLGGLLIMARILLSIVVIVYENGRYGYAEALAES